MLAFRSANCAGVIAPASSAASPYCTPTLSRGLGANPVLGSTPSWLTICWRASHFTPFGFVVAVQIVFGSPGTVGGIAGLQLAVAWMRLANEASQDGQLE